ncbi:MAG: sulfite exporter TauE/SafE family protein [Bacteriovoracaceae bacterium]|jgi:uncharacterized membrane protein YfcA
MFESYYLFLAFCAFLAGFVDSIVGGGGFIQLPALLIALPEVPVVQLLGTNKLISFSGTSVALFRFAKHIKLSLKTLLPCAIMAFLFSLLGSYLVTLVPNDFLRPVFLVVLILMFIYTVRNKHFGMEGATQEHRESLVLSIVLGILIGFYDGFVGPGTGSFLIIAFVSLFRLTFVQASAYAKVINLTTNLAAIILFVSKGAYLWKLAIPMAIMNILGSLLGVKLALLKGNRFIRILFRLVILLTILRFGYDVILP